MFHIFYANWMASLLSMFGGWLFSYRYTKTKSLIAISLEHGFGGDFLFTIGIGWYFYSGSIR